MASFLDSLHLTLLDAAEGLPGVTTRKMFGCHALFRDAQIFALVWQEGVLALRLPDAAAYAEVAAVRGSEPWMIAKSDGKVMTMGHWRLLPEEWNDGGETLADWVRRAHALAAQVATKTKRPKPKAKAKAR